MKIIMVELPTLSASIKEASVKEALCVFVHYCSGQLVLYVSGHPSEWEHHLLYI